MKMPGVGKFSASPDLNPCPVPQATVDCRQEALVRPFRFRQSIPSPVLPRGSDHSHGERAGPGQRSTVGCGQATPVLDIHTRGSGTIKPVAETIAATAYSSRTPVASGERRNGRNAAGFVERSPWGRHNRMDWLQGSAVCRGVKPQAGPTGGRGMIR